MKTKYLFDEYYKRVTSNLKPSTVLMHNYMIKQILEFFEIYHIAQTKQINYNTGYDLIAFLKNTYHKKNVTINRYISFIKRVLIFNDIMSPFLKFKNLRKDTKPYQRLYHEDLKLIVNYLSDLNDSKNSLVYKTLIYFLLDSGVRISEALAIKKHHIDFGSDPYRILLTTTKTNKTRYAPFSDFSKDYILKLMKSHEQPELFWNLLKDRPLIKNDVRQFYRRLSKKLGIEHIHSHRFRKTFASMLIENGLPIEHLQIIFDHSRISTTMLYAQFKQETAFKSYSDHTNFISIKKEEG